MPTYMYRAVTSSGLVVRNRVEAASKQNLLRTLKENDLWRLINGLGIKFIGTKGAKILDNSYDFRLN